MRLRLLIVLLGALLTTGGTVQSSTEHTAINREVISQLSTLNALMAGNYEGIDTVKTLKESGDFGLGTFEGLDGEMIMLDGEIYQAKASGEVVVATDKVQTPFAAVTFFDKDIEVELKAIKSIEALKVSLDKLIKEKDAFYAIRVDANFSYVKVRSVPKQQKPYPLLSEITKEQPVFEYKDVKGTLVGFWCPEYVGEINVPGYHLHFISDDRAYGGHLLELEMTEAAVELDTTRQFAIKLADKTGNYVQGGMGKEEIEKVEK